MFILDWTYIGLICFNMFYFPVWLYFKVYWNTLLTDIVLFCLRISEKILVIVWINYIKDEALYSYDILLEFCRYTELLKPIYSKVQYIFSVHYFSNFFKINKYRYSALRYFFVLRTKSFKFQILFYKFINTKSK